jgi:hypothetical protein
MVHATHTIASGEKSLKKVEKMAKKYISSEQNIVTSIFCILPLCVYYSNDLSCRSFRIHSVTDWVSLTTRKVQANCYKIGYIVYTQIINNNKYSVQNFFIKATCSINNLISSCYRKLVRKCKKIKGIPQFIILAIKKRNWFTNKYNSTLP